MKFPAANVEVHHRTHGASDDAPPSQEYRELWFSVARRDWTSLVLVPVAAGGSAAKVATSLADVGTRLQQTSLTAITAKSLDFNSAYVLADLQRYLSQERGPGPAVDITRTMKLMTPGSSGAEQAAVPEAGDPAAGEPDAAGGEPARGDEERVIDAVPMTGKLILAIPPVVVDPLGVAIAQAGGTVVLCIELGRTSLADAAKTIRLIGRELIAGCFLIRDGRRED